MTGPPARSLNHFAVFRFTPDYWLLPAQARRNTQAALLAGFQSAAPAVHCYQLFPTAARSDFLVWTALPVETPDAPAESFAAYVDGTAPLRQYVEPVSVLWGFTKQSEYSTARSRQAMDPFAPERAPYLIVYPFSKTAEWYLLEQESRQALMNDHMRIGKQYPEIRQLLLYSFGLQDQEFVVVYETDDLARFSALVHELRGTEARRFTLTDAPVHTALHRPADAPFALWT